MNIDKDFNLMVGLRIREVREVLRMTREQFSERCDISDSFLAAVENGQKSITSKTLFKICSNTNISADYIIFGKQYGYQMDIIMEMLIELDISEEHTSELQSRFELVFRVLVENITINY